MSLEKQDGDRIIAPNDQLESSLDDQGICSGPSSAGETVLKKGPWSYSEDAILVEYIRKHGDGNWNAAEKSTGLYRSGKSCRLRWTNHLRPGLTKRYFTPEEEKMIAYLHYCLGNKWARMAAFIPGRSDNDIKNYWNTRIKRRHRAGLPLYPTFEPDYRIPGVTPPDERDKEVLQGGMSDFSNIGFKPFVANPGTPSHSPLFRDISSTGLVSQGLGSHTHGFNAGMNRAMVSQGLGPQNRGNMDSGQRMFEQLPHGPDSANKNLFFPGYSKPGSLFQPNDNFSTSRPLTGTVKVELPSVQYPETDSYGWAFRPPPYEAIHTHIQSPVAVSAQPNFASPSTFVQGSHAMSPAWEQSAEKRLNYPAISPSNMPRNYTANISAADWEGLSDPNSHFYQSAASLFSDCAPTSNSFFDEQPGPTSLQFTDPSAEQIPSQNVVGPGALLGSGWNTGASREPQ